MPAIKSVNSNGANRANAPGLAIKEKVLKSTSPSSKKSEKKFKTASKNTKTQKANLKENTLDKILNHKYFKFLSKLGILGLTLGNGFSTIVNFLHADEATKKTVSIFGDIGTRLFLFTNGNANFLEQLKKKNYFLAISYFLENAVLAFAKHSKIFLARGLVSGAYTLGNALNLINKKTKFKSMEDNAIHVIQGFKKAFTLLKKNAAKNFMSSETGLSSIIAGLMKILGTSIWLLTGQEILGSTIRNSANIIQNIEQLKFKNASERPNFFISGIGTTLGTIFDYVSKFKESSKGVLVPMSLLFDLFGISYLRDSQNSDEMSQTKHEDHNALVERHEVKKG